MQDSSIEPEIIPGTGDLASGTLEKNLPLPLCKISTIPYYIRNLTFISTDEYLPSLNKEASPYCTQKPSQKSPAGPHADRDQQIMGSPVPMDASVSQLLHLWVRGHHRRRGKKVLRARSHEVCCATLPPINDCRDRTGTVSVT